MHNKTSEEMYVFKNITYKNGVFNNYSVNNINVS